MRVNTHSITHDASVPSADSTSGDPQADKTRGTLLPHAGSVLTTQQDLLSDLL